MPTDSGIASIDDLAGLEVGVQAGTNLVEYPGDPELWSALQAGQIDAILQDLPVNVERARADESYVIAEEYTTDEQYGYAMATDASPELVDAVNTTLQDLRDSGTYQEIYDSYFAVDAD